jgi:RHS repeat-associated protein
VYNFAGQLTTLNYNDLSITGTVYLPGWLQTETRTYNNMLQLTRIVNSPNSAYGADGVALNMTYNFSAAQNNGRILSSVDGVTGENVSYTYDSLNRLIAASTSGTAGVQWGNSYSYDGFGNLTGKTVTKGTAPTLSPLVDPNTNRVRMSGDYGYDANGNWMGVPSAPNTWNVENQLLSTGMVDGDGNLVTYTYDPWGRRVMQYGFGAPNTTGTATLYFYSITGKRLGTYTVSYEAVTGASGITMYFGARPLKAVDRLGSVRANFGSNGVAQIAYYPWGEERPQSNGLTPDGTDKFATYFRDGFGQDYANARYYNSNLGRFWSPDPSGVGRSPEGAYGSGSGTSGGVASISGGMVQAPTYQPGAWASDPQGPVSWNRYLYAADDPVNASDPSGLTCVVNEDGSESNNGDGNGTCEQANNPTNNYQVNVTGTSDTAGTDPSTWQGQTPITSGGVPPGYTPGPILTGPGTPAAPLPPKLTVAGCFSNPEWLLSFYVEGPGDSQFHHPPPVVYAPVGQGARKPGALNSTGGAPTAANVAAALFILAAERTECLALLSSQQSTP